MLIAGSGKADITPPVGLPLSGFAVRQNRPSTAIDDPLTVKAIVFQSDGYKILLLSYDLLGLDQALDQSIRERLYDHFGVHFFADPLLLTTTHTHSAPPTMPIAGETRVPQTYIEKILDATIEAVTLAMEGMAEVYLYHASTDLQGINFNRRQSQFPLEPTELFPFDPTFDLWVFKTKQGACHAAMVRFSCHGVTRCDMHVSADYIGDLTQRLEEILGTPCLFMQGTAGDNNPTVSSQDQAGVKAFVDRIFSQIDHLPARLAPYPEARVAAKGMLMNLPFAPFPAKETIRQRIAQNQRILAGDISSPDLQALINGYMGWRFPDEPDIKGTIQHWAAVDIQAAEMTLQAIDRPDLDEGVPFHVNALTLEPFILLFLSGEILTTIGRKISELFPNGDIKIISYLSPVVGYIATQDDYRIGGYEPDGSTMWYRQPGPFRTDIDQDIIKQIKLLLDKN